MSVLTGSAPVSSMRDYQSQVVSYTKGRGRLFLSLKGYAPCPDQEEIVNALGYDSERDLGESYRLCILRPRRGICGAWYEVEDYMHMESQFADAGEEEDPRPFVSGDRRPERMRAAMRRIKSSGRSLRGPSGR